MHCGYESDFYLTIQQDQFTTEITHGCHARLFGREAAELHHGLAQITNGNQFGAGCFCDRYTVANVIAVAVGDQNQVGLGDFCQVFRAIFIGCAPIASARKRLCSSCAAS